MIRNRQLITIQVIPAEPVSCTCLTTELINISNRLLMCDWQGLHDLVSEKQKGGTVKNLGEQICDIVLGVHMLGIENVLVPDGLDPFLPAVNMFESGLETCVVAEDLCSSVVHLQMDW